MKTFHVLGHNHKWNLDAYFTNQIGNGFLLTAHSFGRDFIGKAKFSGHDATKVLERSMIDLQFYGKKESSAIKNPNFESYDFHPAKHKGDSVTNAYLVNSMLSGIEFQEKNNFKTIIIPHYYEAEDFEKFLGILKTLNKELNKKSGLQYLMTIPLSHETLLDSGKVDRLLFALTEDKMVFDGYFLAFEQRHEYKQKLSLNMRYLNNSAAILSTLKRQQFMTVLGYANWDAILYLALTDIDVITIGTYENLRNFTIERYTHLSEGGPSKGWYFSTPLLNFVKAQLLDTVRLHDCLDLIRNSQNIFSDIILEEDFLWNMHKAEVHKNYLLSIDRMLHELAEITDLAERKEVLLAKIQAASDLYRQLSLRKVVLSEESSNYHLGVWETFLRSR